MEKIQYVSGDATKPIGNGHKLIIHCCNDIGAWGAGFVLALSRRWKHPEDCYRQWAHIKVWEGIPFELGQTQIVPANGHGEIFVGNMIGQRSIGRDSSGNPPIRYEAIEQCLYSVVKAITLHPMSVHCPKFGSDLAGGKWSIIEKIIEITLIANNIPVTVYNYEI